MLQNKTNFAKLQIMQILIFFFVVRRLTNMLFFKKESELSFNYFKVQALKDQKSVKNVIYRKSQIFQSKALVAKVHEQWVILT